MISYDGFEKQYFIIKDSIFNMGLTPMQITVYCAIASMANDKTKSIAVKYSTIATRANVSYQSVVRAVKVLIEKGLIIRKNRYRWWSDFHKISNSYKISNLCSKTFTMIPMSIWNYNLSPQALTVFLYLSSKADADKNYLAFPSYTELEKDINMTKSTLVKHIDELQEAKLIDKCFYMTMSAGFGHNQYYVLCKVNQTTKKPHTNDYNFVIVKAGNKIFKVMSYNTNRLQAQLEFKRLKQIS